MDFYVNYHNESYDDDDEYIDHSPMDILGILIDKKFHSLFLVKIKNAINLEQDYYNINSFKSKLMFN